MKYNFNAEMRERGTVDGKTNWFHFLILRDSNKEELHKMLDDPNYNSSEMEVVVTINGHEINKENFNSMVEEWVERCLNQEKEAIKFGDFEAAVKKMATEMVKERFGDALDKLNDAAHNIEYISDHIWDK